MRQAQEMITPNEKMIMEIFWREAAPLTSVDLQALLPEDVQEWKNGYLHNLLKSLLDKKFLEVVDIVQIGRRFAKQYIPTITKEQYAGKVIAALDFKPESLENIIYAISNEIAGKNGEDTIALLKTIIEKSSEK